MQPDFAKRTLAFGLMMGTLMGAAGRTLGQDESLPLEPSAATAGATLSGATAGFNPQSGSTLLEQWGARGTFSEHEARLVETIVASLDEKAGDLFEKVAQRSIGVSQESILLQRDFEGRTLLQNLAEVCGTKFAPSLEVTRHEIVCDLLLEISNPGELNQASWSVCGTGLVYPLYLEYPAEAARLVGALLSPEGRCLLKDGSTLERAPYSLLPDARPGRSVSERLLMSALMERANGELKYCSQCDSHYDPRSGAMPHSGLTNLEISTLYRAVFGTPQAWLQRGANSSGTLMGVVKQESGVRAFVPVVLAWGSSETPIKSFRHVTSEGDNTVHKSLVSESPTSVQSEGAHFILVTKVDPEKVYFRNLHGPTKVEKGTKLLNPTRIVEDPASGIESMTRPDFEKYLMVVFKKQ